MLVKFSLSYKLKLIFTFEYEMNMSQGRIKPSTALPESLSDKMSNTLGEIRNFDSSIPVK